MTTDWIGNSVRPDEFTFDFHAVTSRRIYIGSPHSRHQLENPAFWTPLPSLAKLDATEDVEVHTDWTSFTDILANPTPLITHYKAVVDIARRNKWFLKDIAGYFWIRSYLKTNIPGQDIYFPWYDTIAEYSRFFGWLNASNSDSDFWDMDQGWELEGVRKNNDVFLRITNPEYDPDEEDDVFEVANIAIGLLKLREQTSAAVHRLNRLASILETQLGRDTLNTPWNSPSPSFGTSTWTPG